MPTAWRIVKKQHAATAFDGEGARLYGGRWNSPGVAMVYLAGTRALAALEMAVHLDRATLLAAFALIPCEIDDGLIETLDASALPGQWRRNPAPPELAAIGDAWIKLARSCALAVPSAVIEEETNFLLNPAHQDFPRIRIGRAGAFELDPRLIK